MSLLSILSLALAGGVPAQAATELPADPALTEIRFHQHQTPAGPAWSSATLSATQAVAAWRALDRRSARTGLHPLLWIGQRADLVEDFVEEDLRTASELKGAPLPKNTAALRARISVYAKASAQAAKKVGALSSTRWQGPVPPDPGVPLFAAEFPANIDSLSEFVLLVLPFDPWLYAAARLSRDSAHGPFLRTFHSLDVSFEAPTPTEFLAISLEWKKRYGASPIAVDGGGYWVRNLRPPKTEKSVRRLAREALLICFALEAAENEAILEEVSAQYWQCHP